MRYAHGRPVAVERVVLSTQHAPGICLEELRAAVREQIILPVIPETLRAATLECLINPTGSFEIGGPEGDTGLTGRKIIVDTYGGSAPHGGGAFSGKDPTKVDRSAAYAARWLAKNVVAAGLARRCTLQLAYAIGVAEPVSLYLEFHGTGRLPEEAVEAWLRQNVDLTPAGIIKKLDLRRPIFAATAAGGHFGREWEKFSWERRDLVAQLLADLRCTSLTPELYSAFRDTDYVVLSSPPVTLRIDESNAELDALLAREGKHTAAFITAWNPYSESKAQEENDRAHGSLMDDLRQRDYALIEGEGKGRVGDEMSQCLVAYLRGQNEGEGNGRAGEWPAERSVLTIGIDQRASEEVGRQFGQNAIVFHEFGSRSRLLVLVEMTFPGSLIDGPELDPIAFAGLKLSDDECDRLWNSTTCRDLIGECPSVEEIESFEIDESAGMSDVYYEYFVRDPEGFRNELRMLILDRTAGKALPDSRSA